MGAYRGVVGICNKLVVVLSIDLKDWRTLAVQAGMDMDRQCRKESSDGYREGVCMDHFRRFVTLSICYCLSCSSSRKTQFMKETRGAVERRGDVF